MSDIPTNIKRNISPNLFAEQWVYIDQIGMWVSCLEINLILSAVKR